MDKNKELELAQEIIPGKTYLVKTKRLMREEDKKIIEKILHEKTGANIVILDGQYDCLIINDSNGTGGGNG